MISVTSVTDKYILQPGLIAKHKRTLEWISAAELWKREMTFFQKLIDRYARSISEIDEKKKMDHFQNILIYYNSEVIDWLTSRLRLHERKLAEMLESKDETKVDYFKEHDAILNELASANAQLVEYKIELFSFIEQIMSRSNP